MDLGLTNVNETYKYVLNQSGANAITLGNGLAVNWNAGGVVDLASAQTINGIKTFSSTIVGSINGNAATATSAASATSATNATNAASVTNGVYTTGNQNIGGTKTFTDPIYSNNLLLQGDNSNGYVRASGGASNLYLGANNTNYVTITSDGQVGFYYLDQAVTTNLNMLLNKYSVRRATCSATTHTITTYVPIAGTKSTLILVGYASASVVTFSTGFRTQGTISVTANRIFVIEFVSDGSNFIECSRTTAII
jgi:hypothetical protein